MKRLAIHFAFVVIIGCTTVQDPLLVYLGGDRYSEYCLAETSKFLVGLPLDLSRCSSKSAVEIGSLLGADEDIYWYGRRSPLEHLGLSEPYSELLQAEISYRDHVVELEYDWDHLRDIAQRQSGTLGLSVYSALKENQDGVCFVVCDGSCFKHAANRSRYFLYYRLPDGELKPLAVFTSPPTILSAERGNYLLVGVATASGDGLFVYDLRKQALVMELPEYFYIGLLNDSQSMLVDRNRTVFLFDHVEGRIDEIFRFGPDYHLDSYAGIFERRNPRLSRIPSSQRFEYMVLRGYKEGRANRSLFVLRRIGKRFELIEHELDGKVGNTYVVTGDKPFHF